MQTFHINTKEKREETGDLFGIFFEDINHAADGGLYAELIQNRAFEFDPIDNKEYHALYAWEKVCQDKEAVELTILTDSPYTEKNPHYLRIETKKTLSGIKNKGFSKGIALKAKETYHFSCYLRMVNKPADIKVRLVGKNGYEYTSAILKADSCEWKKHTVDFYINEDEGCGEAQLEVLCCEPGSFELDFVSLFPHDTYKNRKNGLRKDLCKLLEAMHPKFIRFPGGCLVHDGKLDENARDSMYRWKNTIGPVENRPARRNNWGYNQTLGLGYYEYFQLAEDIGAEPLPVIPAAYDPHHQRKVSLDELKPWIDDALDLIEFANGDETTVWGKKRTQLGHPKPFGLKYLAIGNEEVGEGFTERYPYFHKAIREKYPDIKLIGSASPFAAGGEYERGWKSARECGCDLIDEHFYMNTDWMIANTDRYDNFKKDDSKVFLGEYASWGNKWENALAEAAFMTGLEKNVHAVALACYAPMFANVDYINWKPDMIWFDSQNSYGSVNYHVQSMFMRHQGTHRLDFELEESPKEQYDRIVNENKIKEKAKTISGEVRVKVHDGEGAFFDALVTNTKTGEKIHLSNHEGTMKQAEQRNAFAAAQKIGEIPSDWTEYTLTLKAKQTSGRKGFLIYIGEENNHILWTLGGWQNLDICLERFKDNKGACLSESMFSVVRHHEYNLKLNVNDRKMEAFADGVSMVSAEDRVAVAKPLYISTAYDGKCGDVIIKAINVTERASDARFVLQGITGRHSVTLEQMKAMPYEENTMDSPNKVVPYTYDEFINGGSFTRSFEPFSITVMRIHL